jgi:hypothetical protein
VKIVCIRNATASQKKSDNGNLWESTTGQWNRPNPQVLSKVSERCGYALPDRRLDKTHVDSPAGNRSDGSRAQ